VRGADSETYACELLGYKESEFMAMRVPEIATYEAP
jgi:hypothetical protein